MKFRAAFGFLFLVCLLFALELSLLTGCAQIVRPTGGPRDTLPPVLDSAASTPNLQTNFKDREINLTYQEFLQLGDVFSQVVVSPPLEFRPEIKLEKKFKTISFTFDERETLRPDATYTINFGEAIKDFTEGNVADARFVFSTGDYIDSLQIRGKIVDAYTGLGVDKVLLMLYDNLSDTVVRTERPFYFAKTGPKGEFLIQNLKADTFKVFALDDQDLNYQFNQATERIGFLDSLIIINDSVKHDLRIRLFTEEPPLRLNDQEHKQYGLVKLFFNREPYDLQLNYDNQGQYYYQETDGDTLRIWYNEATTPVDWSVYVQADTIRDTVRVKKLDRNTFLQKARLRQTNVATGNRLLVINPNEGVILEFNHPIETTDTSKIRLLADSTKTPVAFRLLRDSSERKKLVVQTKWTPDIDYELQLHPGALQDCFGLSNTDTLKRPYKAKGIDQYGIINLTVNRLDSAKAYAIELLFKDKVVDQGRARFDTSFYLVKKGLEPGKYTVRIIEDLNDNGRWDPGHYDSGRQPEKVYTSILEEVRPNWEVEAKVGLGEGGPPEPSPSSQPPPPGQGRRN
jgi:hypothetical protein